MVIILILLIIILTLSIIRKGCFIRNNVFVNHVFCVSAGYLYYGIIPIICYEFGFDFNDTVFKNLLSKYELISTEVKMEYLIISLLMYLAFLTGSGFKNKYLLREVTNKKQQFYKKICEFMIFVNSLGIGFVSIWFTRNELFAFYKANSIYKGVFSGLVYLFIGILINIYATKSINSNVTQKVCNKWFGIWLVFSFLLLTMGGRLYVITSIVALLTFYSCYCTNGIQLYKILIILFVGIFACGFLSILRMGYGFNISAVFYNILQEPLYTSYSLITYLSDNNFFLIDIPDSFISSISNLLPSTLFVNKSNFITTLYDKGINYEAPLGALHYFVSFIGDFGIIGSILFWFCFGLYIRKLYVYKFTNYKLVSYSLICSMLVFTVYRDPVSISFIKGIFQFSVLLPFFVNILIG